MLRPGLPSDAIQLGVKLSELDVDEARAAHGLGPIDSLLYDMSRSAEVIAIEEELTGGTIALYGVIVPDTGAPAGNVWLLCGPEVKGAPISFSKIVREQLSTLCDKYGVLYGYVDERNRDHVRWLRRIGFRMLRAIQGYGHEGRTFFEFVGTF